MTSPDETWAQFEIEYLPTLEHHARTLAEQSGIDPRLLYDRARDVMCRRWPELGAQPPFEKQLHFAIKVLRSTHRDLLKAQREQPMEDVSVCGGGQTSRDWTADPEAALIRKEEANRVYQLIRQLPENLRTVYILRTTMQMEPGEIAEELHMSRSNVSSTYCRAVTKLKKLAREEGLL